MKSGVAVLALTIFFHSSFSQEQSALDTVQTNAGELEKALEDMTQDLSDSQLVDALAHLEENPLDLNSASEAEFLQVPSVNSVLAFRIVAFREQSKFTRVEDVLRIDGVTRDIFQRMRPYIMVATSREEPSADLFSSSLRTRTTRDIQVRSGYQDGGYLGSPVKSYNRFVARYQEQGTQSRRGRRYSELGILMEKDAGEQKLNDFAAGYLMINAPAISGRFILGDFVVEAAEGLVLWRSIGFSKGSEVISTTQKRGTGIKPYLSTDESLFLRGIAAEWSMTGLSLVLFHSNKPISASIDTNGTITSLFSDGYHRTPREIAKKNNSREALTGARALIELSKGLFVGGTIYRAGFAHQLSLSKEFGGLHASLSVGGLDVTYSGRSASLFGEMAGRDASSLAGVAGIILEPSNRLNVALIVRSYPKDFLNPHAFGFREGGSLTQNESGIYLGARFSAARWLRCSFYFDQFQFPWRTSSLELPTSGNDFLSLAEADIVRDVRLQLQYRNRNRPSSTTQVDAFGRQQEILNQRNQTNYRFTMDYSTSPRVDLRSRFEVVRVRYSSEAAPERGFLWLQDGRMKLRRDFTLDGRVIIFHTDSFDSRLYEFEHDVRGTFANPALFGKGVRWYIVTRFELATHVGLSAKYSRTVKDGVRSLSSGESEIIGDMESVISFQIDVAF